MEATPEPGQKRSVNPLAFGVSASLTILFVLWAALFPESMETAVNAAFSWTTETWGWLFLWTAFPLMFLLLWSVYGTFKGLIGYLRTQGQG
jgi:glycine betaine transporter